MMKITAQKLRRAAQIAREIEDLEMMRETAEDAQVVVQLGSPPSAQHPLGHPMGVHLSHEPFQPLQPQMPGAYLAKAVNPAGETVTVTVPATTIRAAMVERLAPLYQELRAMGVELDR